MPLACEARKSMDEAISAGFAKYKPAAEGKYFPYGTAGFRSKGSVLDHVVYRCGILTVLRSYAGGKEAVGACITASHNQAEDNGIKLTDPDGGMLNSEFEKYATEFINSDTPLEWVLEKIHAFIKPNGLREGEFQDCVVFLGRDTRQTSPHLSQIFMSAVKALNAKCIDVGIVTTPQLHFLVRHSNLSNSISSVPDYYKFFFDRVMEFLSHANLASEIHSRFLPETLVVDGANGVGARAVKPFASLLLSALNVKLEIRNDGMWPSDILNFNCGAEVAQKENHFPLRFGKFYLSLYFFAGPHMYDPINLRCCAFDGDADRLVYFTSDFKGDFLLLDGDKIAVLFAMAIMSMIKDANNDPEKSGIGKLNIGVVQTAYANGASTEYLESLKHLSGGASLDVAFVKTGVKFLHRKAEDYDIGIYFESNGHGTVMSKQAKLQEWFGPSYSTTKSFLVLESFLKIFNQATGDAMTDMLSVEAALRPTIQRKIPMPRSRLNTLQPHPEHEKWLIEPAATQDLINAACLQFTKARAFIRASGTEEVCRLYVETSTQEESQLLAEAIENTIKQLSN